ncbi:MAG: transporter substrate-binding domain-containing protein [Treponema sp.]|jgi:L-cystine transport system substrate-binding protein|nr:transporter substrate-binding domain-containing protein [Treponema sp.]
MKVKRTVLTAVTLFMMLPAVVFAGGKSDKAAAGGAVINVGTMGTYEPFSLVDPDGRVTGYDIEVLRLLEKVDPSLRFEFHAGPWDSLFPALDSDRYQLIAQQIVRTPERVAKYSLTDQTYHTCISQLIVKKGRTDIQGLESLQGKRIGTTVGDNFTRFLEEWNKTHGDILTIVYYEEDITTVLQDIVNGRIDATLNDPVMAAAKAAAQGLDVEPVGARLEEEGTIFIAKQDAAGKALTAKLDAALVKVHADGRLSALSTEWFGEDYSK